MRIVFLGTPEFTLPLLEACARAGDLVAVIAQPDRPADRHAKLKAPPAKIWAQQRGIPVLQPEKVKQGRLAALLADHQPDLAVVAAYGRILPPAALLVPAQGCINVHASLLPDPRGAAPARVAANSAGPLPRDTGAAAHPRGRPRGLHQKRLRAGRAPPRLHSLAGRVDDAFGSDAE